MVDVNKATDYFVNSMGRAIASNFVLKVIPNRKRTMKPWMTLGLLRCMKNRDNMHLKLKMFPNDEFLKQPTHRYRSFCSAILKKAKNVYKNIEI